MGGPCCPLDRGPDASRAKRRSRRRGDIWSFRWLGPSFAPARTPSASTSASRPISSLQSRRIDHRRAVWVVGKVGGGTSWGRVAEGVRGNHRHVAMGQGLGGGDRIEADAPSNRAYRFVRRVAFGQRAPGRQVRGSGRQVRAHPKATAAVGWLRRSATIRIGVHRFDRAGACRPASLPTPQRSQHRKANRSR